MKKTIMILASFFVLVFFATTTYARTPDGNKLNTSPFYHDQLDTDSDGDALNESNDPCPWVDGMNAEEDNRGNGKWDSDDSDDDQIVDTDGDAIDGTFEGHGSDSAADTDGDGLNENEDACPWGDETDGEKCVANIKLEDLFPF